jgi:hypothetical protein
VLLRWSAPAGSGTSTATLGVLAAVAMAVGAIYAVLRPERGIQDRLAGTQLVPE